MKTRRHKGSGSLYKEGDLYRVQKEIGVIDGKRKYRRWTFHTLKEAQAKLRLLQDTTIARGSIPTVGKYLAATLAEAESRLRPRTHRSYQQTVEHHITPYLGHLLVSDLTPLHVETWLHQLKAKHPKHTATVRYARVVLRTLLKPAQRNGWLVQNPAALATAPKHRKHAIQPLTLAQATALLSAIHGHWLEPIVLLCLSLGLRKGEVLALQWKDLDFTAGTLTVRRALQRAYIPRGERKTSLVVADVKTESSRRTMKLPAVLAETLQKHRDEVAPLRSKWVFCTLHGTPREPRNVSRAWYQVRVLAGVPTLRLHDLRHSAATFALLLGIAPRTVADMLGHAETRTTLDTYTHVLPALRDGVAEQIDAMLRSVKPTDRPQ